MQYLKVLQDMTLSQLSDVVGERNVDYVLNTNSLERSVNIGKQFVDRNNQIIHDVNTGAIDSHNKMNILNQFVGDSDIFEKAALGTEDDWITLSYFNCFTDYLKIPADLQIPSAEDVLGNGVPVSNKTYDDCMNALELNENIDPAIFSDYNVSYVNGTVGIDSNGRVNVAPPGEQDLYQCFAIPWGEICLYSSLSNEMIYFPVYPEGFDDGVSANYDEMSEMLYQYEPWKVYKSSGPREISFTFKFHRDMWTGDHRDGHANNLIRACKANCYPEYNGALVRTSIVSLYIHGRNFITGVMTDCKVNWDRPIGLDGFYLVCELSFTITEVSQEALSFSTMRNKELIS